MPQLQLRRRQAYGLRAFSAAQVRLLPDEPDPSGESVRSASRSTSGTRSWQEKAFAFNKTLGPIQYAAQFYAKMLSRLETFVGEVDNDGKVDQTKNAAALAAFADVQDPGGGRSRMQEKYGHLMFLAGEAYLVGTLEADLVTWVWEVLSTSEWRPGEKGGRKYRRYRQPGSIAEEHDEAPETPTPENPLAAGQVRSYRLWRADPEYSDEPWSPMRAVIEDCETLQMMYHQLHGVTMSRLSSCGILAIPNSLTIAGEPNDENKPDDDPESDGILKRIVAAAQAAIRNHRSAAAALPIILRGEKEDIDAIKHIDFASTRKAMLLEERDELVKRLAIGLDMPPEILLGLEQSNHWTAWAISEQVWESHGRPISEAFCDEMSEVILRPRLIAAGMSLDEALRYRVAFDASSIVSHPNQTRDWFGAHDRLVVSNKSLLEKIGGDPTKDAPDQAEYDQRVALWTRPKLGSTTGGSPGAPTGAGMDTRAHAIEGAVLVAIARAREAAGSKLRVKAQRMPDLAERIRSVPNHRLAAELTGVGAAALGHQGRPLRVEDLVTGTTRPLGAALEQLGVPEHVIVHLCAHVETHVAQTLFSTEPAGLPLDVHELIRTAAAA